MMQDRLRKASEAKMNHLAISIQTTGMAHRYTKLA